MADENTLFFLEEDEDMGGFNDPIVPVEEDATEETDKDKDLEGGKTKDQDDDDANSEDDDEVKKEPDGFEQKFNEAIGLVSSITEQNKALTIQIEALQKQPAKQEPSKAERPEKLTFSQDQWDADSQACMEQLNERNREIDQFDQNIANETASKEADDVQQNTQAIATKQWADVVAVNPELGSNPAVNKVWNDLYVSSGDNAREGGVLTTTMHILKMAKEKNIDLATWGQPKSEIKTKTDLARGAEDEAARVERVAKSAMHAGTKKTKDTKGKVNLTPDQLGVCRQMNIKPESYAETLSAMGRG